MGLRVVILSAVNGRVTVDITHELEKGMLSTRDRAKNVGQFVSMSYFCPNEAGIKKIKDKTS